MTQCLWVQSVDTGQLGPLTQNVNVTIRSLQSLSSLSGKRLSELKARVEITEYRFEDLANKKSISNCKCKVTFKNCIKILKN